MVQVLPRLYAVLDAGAVAKKGLCLLCVARDLRIARVALLQYRDKIHDVDTVLANADRIQEIFQGSGCKLLLNDFPDLCVRAGWDGVHIGQNDCSVEEARRTVGEARWVGVSTHTMTQLAAAQETSANYVAIGPVFPTGTKSDAEPAVGLAGVREARQATDKALVAIGGIDRADAGSVIKAGADAIAVISALLVEPHSIVSTVRNFQRELD